MNILLILLSLLLASPLYAAGPLVAIVGGGVPAAGGDIGPFTYVHGVAGFNSASSTSLATTEGGPNADGKLVVQAGDLLIAWAKWEDGAGGTLSVRTTTTFENTLTATTVTNSNTESYAEFFYQIAATAHTAKTYTFANSTSRPYRVIMVMQFRPASGETVTLDPAASNPAFGTGSTAALLSGNITTLGTDDVVVGAGSGYTVSSEPFSALQIGDVNATGSITLASSYTYMWYRILTTTMSAGHAQGTMSDSSSWVCGVIGFKSAP